MKKVRLGTKNYYMVNQATAIVEANNNNEAVNICKGCVFDDRHKRPVPFGVCPQDSKGDVLCQTYTEREDGHLYCTEHIFVPATRAGLAAFAIHRLENS